jgi:hypothetical protein
VKRHRARHSASFAVLTAGALSLAAAGVTASQATTAPPGPTATATAPGVPRGVYFPPATPGSRPGPNERTVEVHEDTGPVNEIAAQMAVQYGLRLLYVRLSRPSFNAYIPPEQVAAVRADPRVVFVTDSPQQFVPDQFIVFLGEGAGDLSQVVPRLERQYGIRAISVSPAGSRSFVAEIPSDRLAAVAADPAVSTVDENQVLGLGSS